MIVTKSNIEQFGGVILKLFEFTYPNGTTIEQMRIDAKNNKWIRTILPQLEKSL